MRTRVLHILAAVSAAAVLLSPAAAWAAPAKPPSAPIAYSVTATDGITTNAIDLAVSQHSAQSEVTSLDARIAVVSEQAAEQSATLAAAIRTQEDAQAVYDARVVEMYQAGEYDLLSILLDADSFSDLIARIEVVSRILDADRSALEEIEIVADQARLQSARLESLSVELASLQSAREQRVLAESTARSSLSTLELQLTPNGRLQLDAVRQAEASYRAKWVVASVPPTSSVPVRSVRVTPYTEKYISSRYHYAGYRTTDVLFTATATWYGDAFNGCTTTSGQAFNASDFTCAHPTLPIGTWLAVTRTDPDTAAVGRVIVVVNDRGPYAAGRDLQLSRAAAERLGLTHGSGGTVSCEVVSPVN